MPKTKKEDNRKTIKLVALSALIVVLVGIVAYAFVQSYSNPSTRQQVDTDTSQQQLTQPAASEADAKEAGIVLSKVKMEMTKDEVVEAVGQPHSCSTKTSTENGKTYVMEQCSYGKKNASGHALITFLNGKVWGTTYETGAIYTDSQQ